MRRATRASARPPTSDPGARPTAISSSRQRSTTPCATAWSKRADTSPLTEEAERLRAIYWDDEGHRTPDTIAVSAQALAEKAGFEIAPDRRFFLVEQSEIGRHNPFSSEKLGVVLSMFRYSGYDEALEKVAAIYEVGGKGHSCGIYSFDDDHIDRLAQLAPVSRIMVRQAQSKANAGSFTNGMPMTSSLGCGTWGGNITSENIHLKHYMNVTWVSRPTPEDRPSEEELFGEFYGTPVD